MGRGNEDIKNRYLRASVRTFCNLINKMKEDIKEHKFDIVIGEDRSGRIPALVVGGLLKLIYAEDKVESPKILFVTGPYEDEPTDKMASREKLLGEYFDYLKANGIIKEKSSVLFVTEFICVGDSLKSFIDVAKKKGINVTIASLEILSDNVSKRIQEEKDLKIYRGDVVQPLSDAGIALYDPHGFKGIVGLKKNYGEIFARKYKTSYVDVKSIRNDVKMIIEKLKKHYDKIK